MVQIAVVCPNCGKKVSKPDRELHNSLFHIAAYTCIVCKTQFKINQ